MDYLWTPWRYQYMEQVTRGKQPDCIFCAIVSGQIPGKIVDQDERTVAFMDINPATRGHALVIPREHYRDLHEVPPEELAATMAAAQRLAGRARDRLGADGVNLLNSCGAAAWQPSRRRSTRSRWRCETSGPIWVLGSEML